MLQIELAPTLSHGGESTAKDEDERSVREYLRAGEGDKELGQKIELLKSFLESADFPQLRQRSEKLLIEGKDVRFVVSVDKGELVYEMRVVGED